MNRNRFFALAAMLILLCLPLAACKSKNPHGLVFVPDGSESVYMLGSDETRSVYALGGTVNCTSGGEMKALSLCLADESISISDIASAVEAAYLRALKEHRPLVILGSLYMYGSVYSAFFRLKTLAPQGV